MVASLENSYYIQEQNTEITSDTMLTGQLIDRSVKISIFYYQPFVN